MSNPTQTAGTVDILIAEDSGTQALRLQMILERQGYRVERAVNGRLALEAALRRKPTLIISDVVMPEMDGYELCRRIKSDPGLADVPFILVTTLADPQDVIRGLECHADNFIPKPYDEDFLLSRVKFVLLNRDVRRNRDDRGGGIEILFNDQRHFITADRRQILNLLLSTYEAAVERNSELSRTQDELYRLNSKLETANHELEAFSSSVSHDLRAPLRHIGGFIDLLSSSLEGKLGEEERSYLETIAGSARRMGRLIDDLLDFAHISRSELKRAEVDLNGIVQAAVGELGPDLKGRNVAWTIASLPSVRADPAMMRQVFANLLGNAVKYSRTRPRAEIEVGTRDEPEEFVVFVRDNGVGFNMAYADKLFGVFQRLHSADQFEGTGVGLANVRRIIARHGGRTWAESKEGEWAVFSFSLPKKWDAPAPSREE